MLTKEQTHAAANTLLQEPRAEQVRQQQKPAATTPATWRFMSALVGALGGIAFGYLFTGHFTSGWLIGLFFGLGVSRILYSFWPNYSSKRTREKPRAA